MANHYPKIDTLFMRDDNGLIIPDSFTNSTFDSLCNIKWECTEKIDGTNIHIDYNAQFQYNDNGELIETKVSVSIHGRTDKAKIPDHLMIRLNELFSPDESLVGVELAEANMAKWNNVVDKALSKAIERKEKELNVIVYGEGYGKKIQAAGPNYLSDSVDFILFDVRVNDWWLSREDCELVADSMNVGIVPLVGYMTIPEAIKHTKVGFKSSISENRNFDAEGLVLKTPTGLRYRNGGRIITKIKTSDFRKYSARYGEGKIKQIPNPFYNKNTDESKI